MSDHSDDSYPMPDESDNLYKMAKTGVGLTGSAITLITSIPGLSILGTELFTHAIVPPVEKRRAQFINDISKDLKELKYNFENLSKNQLFVTAILQGIQIAVRSHQPEKLDALRSAVLNTARPLFIEDNIALMFLNLIDVSTPWHMRVLNHLKSKPTSVYLDYGLDDERLNIDLIVNQLKDKFPGDPIDPEFLNQVIKDLSDRGLARIKNVRMTEHGEMPVDALVTNLGEKFLDFITTYRPKSSLET